MEACVRTEVRECLGEARVRYHHISILSHEDRSRRGKEELGDEEEQEKKTPVKSKDPLKWFGVLSHPSFKQSQVAVMRFSATLKIERTSF